MIQIYTDGGYRISKNVGGWAFVLINEDSVVERASATYNTTNNKMEITALLEGLKYVQENNLTKQSIEVYSDSTYIINSATDWVYNWVRYNFFGKKNKELWMQYLELSKGLNLSFIWVKGHAGNYYNERCDQLASEAIDLYLQSTKS